MIEKEFETVSSLVDGYEPSSEQLGHIGDDELLSDTWERYHLIGDVMRDEANDSLSLELCENIAVAIAQEPTVLAPKPSKNISHTVKSKVIKFVKPVGQMAIAASAAGLMILGVQTNVAENETVVPQQVVQTIPLGGIADPVSFNYTTNDRASQKKAYIEQQRRFQALLADHQQQIKLSSVVKVQETDTNEKVEDLPK